LRKVNYWLDKLGWAFRVDSWLAELTSAAALGFKRFSCGAMLARCSGIAQAYGASAYSKTRRALKLKEILFKMSILLSDVVVNLSDRVIEKYL
jgi:uncharacterized membrane protein YidH (DUF202 family)